MANITVLGAGAWGTAFGQVLADAGNDVMMWAIEPDIVKAIQTEHRNPVRLPSVEKLPDSMTATGDRAEAVAHADVVVVAIAAQFARQALEEFNGLIPDEAVVVSLMKGIEQKTGKRMDQVVTEALDLPADRFVAISGPNLSKQIAAREPAAAVVGCTDIDVARRVAKLCTTDYFKTFITADVIGLELCGSLKNVVALAVGMAHGAGFGENTAAMIETRGLTEIKDVGTGAGALPETFYGLAGVGDLIVTCCSMHSRDRRCGILIGQGKPVDEAVKEIGAVVEGYYAANNARTLARKAGVEMPIAQAAYEVLYEGRDVHAVVEDLMQRAKRSERDESYL